MDIGALDKTEKKQAMRVAILAYDGCVASGVSGFGDVLAVANHLVGRELFSVRVLSADGAPVRVFSGPPLTPDGSLFGGLGTKETAPDRAGGSERWGAVYVPPAVGLREPAPELVRFVRQAHARGAIGCAACAGVFFLAAAGLLDGRSATTHWGLVDQFVATYPQVLLEPDRILVDGGDSICAGGLTAYFDLALHLIVRFASPGLAAACARMLLLDPGRARQTPYRCLVGPPDHGDEAVTRAQEWVERNHERPLSIREMAAAVHLGERTLLRRFRRATGRTPNRYLQAVRIEHAKRLLESGGATVDRIIADVGYRDAPAFYRLFKEFTGLTPGEYRTRFGMRERSV